MKLILVIGDYIQDMYTFGRATRLCPEAPVPVVIPEIIKESAGGAGLVNQQLRQLGADTISAYGSFSRKSRYFAGNHLICRVDEDSMDEDCFKIEDEPIGHLLRLADAIVVSDYGKGAMTQELAAQIVATGKPCFVDAKDSWHDYCGENVTIFPNEREHQCQCADYFAIVTKLGAKGCAYYSNGHTDYFRSTADPLPATVSEVVDVTGAGDIFMASFVYAWSLQHPAEDCLRFANEMAGESCRHRGTYVVPLEFAQGILCRIGQRTAFEQLTRLNSLCSSLAEQQQQPLTAQRAVALDAQKAYNLRVNSELDRVMSEVAGYSSPLVQIRQKSPSVPTESTDTPTPLDQGTGHESGDAPQSAQPDQSSTDSECPHERISGPDQGWIG